MRNNIKISNNDREFKMVFISGDKEHSLNIQSIINFFLNYKIKCNEDSFSYALILNNKELNQLIIDINSYSYIHKTEFNLYEAISYDDLLGIKTLDKILDKILLSGSESLSESEKFSLKYISLSI